MTTDNPNFFDDLERELVAATTDRTRRLRRARARRAATASTIAIAVLAAGGGLAAAVTSTDSSNNGAPAQHSTPATTTSNGDRLAPAHAKPGTFTVAVLNGTTVPGLARGVANRLTNGRHKVGTVTNAATQDRATTIVYYLPGRRAAAEEVAHGIEVAQTAIRPATPGVRVIAGEDAAVIVLVGSDQNTAPQQSH